jgi:hypothetical protein
MRLTHIIIECDDYDLQLRFWTAALGPGGGIPADAELLLRDRAEPLSTVGRASVEGYGRHGALGLRFGPDRGPVEEEVARLVGLGASVVRKYHSGWGIGEVVMADPEGNEFLLESNDDDSVIEARMERGERGDGGPFWADAVPPHPLESTLIGVAFESEATPSAPADVEGVRPAPGR